eukprot:10728735-Heterocapsa_arctica.AAC.1
MEWRPHQRDHTMGDHKNGRHWGVTLGDHIDGNLIGAKPGATEGEATRGNGRLNWETTGAIFVRAVTSLNP